MTVSSLTATPKAASAAVISRLARLPQLPQLPRFHTLLGMTALLWALTAPALSQQASTPASTKASAAKSKAVPTPFRLPPSATLEYKIKASQSGVPLEGKAQVQWRASDQTYSVRNEARANLLGKILESHSEGKVDADGLAPQSFQEKRLRKDATRTRFDREQGVIRFEASGQTQPIERGVQDRDSVVWQLVSVARALPRRFQPGTEWRFLVAGARDADPWSFKVIAMEKLRTPLGDTSALHLVKQTPEGSKNQQVDLWLAPQREWYPIRVRYTEKDGDYIEQTLEAIKPLPAS